MLVAEDYFTWNARENKAIAHLCAALDQVVATGRPAPVRCFPESLTTREFVAIAVDLCKRADVNAAVLGDRTMQGVTLVPLLARVTPAPRTGARGATYAALATAGADAFG
jgi:hypothetical protein